MAWAFLVALYPTSVLYNAIRLFLCRRRLEEFRLQQGLSRKVAAISIGLFVALGFVSWILGVAIRLFKTPDEIDVE